MFLSLRLASCCHDWPTCGRAYSIYVEEIPLICTSQIFVHIVFITLNVTMDFDHIVRLYLWLSRAPHVLLPELRKIALGLGHNSTSSHWPFGHLKYNI